MRALLPVPFIIASFLDARGQGEYTFDGAPTADAEAFRWLLNRGRFDRTAENAALGTSYTDIPLSAPPVAPHQSLTKAAQNHTADMARTGNVRHETLPNSPYYNAATQPHPIHRMAAEGYHPESPLDTTNMGENVSGGNPTITAVYLGWRNSTGHRTGMFGPNRREMGFGYVLNQSSTFWYYHTLKLNSAQNRHFFTGTLFADNDANRIYTQGEGIGGIRVELLVGGTPHPHFDLSSPSGSFVIPIESIPFGNRVEVVLRNPSNTPITLTIPTDYHTLRPLQLAPGAQHVWGAFTKHSTPTNVGFRNLTLVTEQPLTAPDLTIIVRNRIATLSWPSKTGETYQIQWSENLVTWQNLTPSPLIGTGSTLTFSDQEPRPKRFYQITVARSP